MSKISSPSSNNSATSSETSETQSVDDSAPGNNTRAVKSWKRLKDEGEKGRPPWRSVSVSTLPKADKNALLRAKLLDASRRLRLSKLSVAIQVELPIYKPSRNIGIPIQRDLIYKHDVSILTDGSITIKKEGPGEFILTHSASQMTEAIVGVDAATQTLLPRRTTRFFEAYLSNNSYDNDSTFTDNEKKLLAQIREIRNIDGKISQKSRSFDEMSEDSISGCGNKTALKQHFQEVSKSSESLLKPTLSSWHFEYPVNDEPDWKPYTTKPTPWSSFANTEMEDRLSKMKLNPNVAKQKNLFSTQELSLNLELFSAVEELINESNNLVNTFNRLSSLAGPDIKLKKIPTLENFEFECLSDYWVPIIEKYEVKTKQLASELTHPNLKEIQPMALEDYEKEKCSENVV